MNNKLAETYQKSSKLTRKTTFAKAAQLLGGKK